MSNKSDDQNRIDEIQEFLKADGIKIDENLQEESSKESSSSEEKILSDVEKIASEYGWKPAGERNAEEYVKYALENLPQKNAELSKYAKTIENKDEKLSKMERTLSELSSHMKKQKDLAYQQALVDIKAQRRNAIAEGDVDRVEALDIEQDNLQANIEPPEAVVHFKERHKDWLNGTSYKEVEIREWAEKRDKQLAQYKLPPDEHMKILESDVLDKFSNYFDSSVHKPAAVDSLQNSNVAGNSKSKKNFTFKDLTDDQKNVAKYLEQNGDMKISDYIQQLIENGDLK